MEVAIGVDGAIATTAWTLAASTHQRTPTVLPSPPEPSPRRPAPTTIKFGQLPCQPRQISPSLPLPPGNYCGCGFLFSLGGRDETAKRQSQSTKRRGEQSFSNQAFAGAFAFANGAFSFADGAFASMGRSPDVRRLATRREAFADEAFARFADEAYGDEA